MLTNKYALAVEIEPNLFEIFDIFYFENGSDIDLRYQKSTSDGAIAIHSKIRNGIKIGAILDNDKFLYDSTENTFDIEEHEDIYLFLSNNKVFGFYIQKIGEPDHIKYEAAFENKVIVIDISLENNVGFGDLWDGQKILRVI